MPGLDNTGPEGQGPMTGRKLGKCASKNAQNTGPGRCLGLGKGKGRGQGQGLGRGQGRGLGRNNNQSS